MALLERLSSLIPPPRRHLIRYSGVLAPAAHWRKKVVPAPSEEPGTTQPRRGRRRLDWANLLRRVFLLEVLACACGGRRRVISAIEEGATARKIPRHLGLPDEPPRLEPVRLDQHELWPTGPPAEDAWEPPPADDWDQRSPLDLA